MHNIIRKLEPHRLRGVFITIQVLMHIRGHSSGRILNLEIYCHPDTSANKLSERCIYIEGKILCLMVPPKLLEDKMVYPQHLCLNGNKSLTWHEGQGKQNNWHTQWFLMERECLCSESSGAEEKGCCSITILLAIWTCGTWGLKMWDLYSDLTSRISL